MNPTACRKRRTRRGDACHDKRAAYVISSERVDSMLETMELLANPEFMRALEAERSGKTGPVK